MYEMFVPSAVCRLPLTEMVVAAILTLAFIVITKPRE